MKVILLLCLLAVALAKHDSVPNASKQKAYSHFHPQSRWLGRLGLKFIVKGNDDSSPNPPSSYKPPKTLSATPNTKGTKFIVKGNDDSSPNSPSITSSAKPNTKDTDGSSPSGSSSTSTLGPSAVSANSTSIPTAAFKPTLAPVRISSATTASPNLATTFEPTSNKTQFDATTKSSDGTNSTSNTNIVGIAVGVSIGGAAIIAAAAYFLFAGGYKKEKDLLNVETSSAVNNPVGNAKT